MRKEEIATLLPFIFQRTIDWEARDNVLAAMLAVMERLHGPSERILDELDTVFDADRTGDSFLPFLLHWVGLGPLLEMVGVPFPTGNSRLRDLITVAVTLARRRGTRESVRRMLETATGLAGFAVAEDPQRPFHIVVTYPPAAAPYRSLVEAIVRLEKPAYATFELQMTPNRRGFGPDKLPGL